MAFNVLFQGAAAAANPSLILNPNHPGFTADAAALSIEVAGVNYIRRKRLAVKVKRSESSLCWDYGERIYRSLDKKAFYYCYDCERLKVAQQLPSAEGTTGARNHMKHYHRRDPDTGVVAVDKEAKKEDKDAVISFVKIESLSKFKELLVRWFVICQLAFFMLENSVFRELIAYLSEGLAAFLPQARATLRRWIIAEYEARKKDLKDELKASLSKIHISFDIWTAGNFRRIYRSHSGENQAQVVLDVLQEYMISSRTGFFICDNATANDAAVSQILETLEPAISTAEATARRLRCFGHIINLAARSLLDPTGSELTIAASELEIDELISATAWQSTPALSKLHKLVKYILASPQRREEFGEITGGRKAKEFDHLGLLVDNATRWNSVYRMLNRALCVRKRLEKFVRDHKPENKATYRPKDERLSDRDWAYIERLYTALQAFETTTEQSEGFKPLLSDWFISLHMLMHHLHEWKVDALEVQGDSALATTLVASWNKLEKYYKLVDQTPVYYAAILLHPALKTQKLQELWNTNETKPWIEPTIELVRQMWQRHYKPINQRIATTHLRLDDGSEESFAKRLARAKRQCLEAPATTKDAFEEYLSIDEESHGKDFDVISWWQQRQHVYPGLAQMAFDVFAIPLMSDDNERSFSSGRDMVTYRRTRLQGDIIEACQCLKSWFGDIEVVFDDKEAIDKDMDTVDEPILVE